MHRNVVALAAALGRGVTFCVVMNLGVFLGEFMRSFGAKNRDIGLALAIAQCLSLAGGKQRQIQRIGIHPHFVLGHST